MTKKATPAQRRTSEYWDKRAREEKDPEGPMTPEQARRELGFDMLPDGTVGEDD